MTLAEQRALHVEARERPAPCPASGFLDHTAFGVVKCKARVLDRLL